LQARGIDLRLVGGHGTLQLAHQCGLGVHLLAGDGVARQQVLIPLEVELRILEQRLVALQRALGLRQRSLVAACIDLGQHLACTHLVAFLEAHRRQLAAHLGAHHGGGAGAHGADGTHHHPHIAPLHGAHRHGLHIVAAKAPGAAARPARRVRARGGTTSGGPSRCILALLPPPGTTSHRRQRNGGHQQRGGPTQLAGLQSCGPLWTGKRTVQGHGGAQPGMSEGVW